MVVQICSRHTTTERLSLHDMENRFWPAVPQVRCSENVLVLGIEISLWLVCSTTGGPSE